MSAALKNIFVSPPPPVIVRHFECFFEIQQHTSYLTKTCTKKNVYVHLSSSINIIINIIVLYRQTLSGGNYHHKDEHIVSCWLDCCVNQSSVRKNKRYIHGGTKCGIMLSWYYGSMILWSRIGEGRRRNSNNKNILVYV